MPEGDTIFRAAATLQLALAGKRVVRFDTREPKLARIDDQTPIAGRTIERVQARGKNLLIELSGDLILRTHMRMNGSWHIYRPGEAWKLKKIDMVVLLETADFVAVGFNVPVAEFHTAKSLLRDPVMAAIGPDVLANFDVEEALRRMRLHPQEEIADVILNQQVLAGIGNVYKSEVLFLTGINPFRRVESLSDDDLRAIADKARLLLRVNVEDSGPQRRTVRGLDRNQLLWVYERHKPCRKCGSEIHYQKQGPHARGTWWCPECQK